MKLVSPRVLIIGTILLLSISQSHGDPTPSRRRRQAGSGEQSNDLDWKMIVTDAGKVPIIGDYWAEALTEIGMGVSKINELTSGALARALGGYPPCIITLESVDSISCTGEAKDGGVQGIIKQLIDGLPIPDFLKEILKGFVNAAVIPTFDVIVGIPAPTDKEE